MISPEDDTATADNTIVIMFPKNSPFSDTKQLASNTADAARTAWHTSQISNLEQKLELLQDRLKTVAGDGGAIGR